VVREKEKVGDIEIRKVSKDAIVVLYNGSVGSPELRPQELELPIE
jgi:hypothetical protein